MGRAPSFNQHQTDKRLMELFWFSGVDSVSARDISKGTGLLLGSLYNHYGHRDDMLAAALRFYIDEVIKKRIEKYLELKEPKFFEYLWTAAEPILESKGQHTCFLIHSRESQGNQSSIVSKEIVRGLEMIREGYATGVKNFCGSSSSIKLQVNQIFSFHLGLLVFAQTTQSKSAVKDLIRVNLCAFNLEQKGTST